MTNIDVKYHFKSHCLSNTDIDGEIEKIEIIVNNYNTELTESTESTESTELTELTEFINDNGDNYSINKDKKQLKIILNKPFFGNILKLPENLSEDSYTHQDDYNKIKKIRDFLKKII